jgi:hypothetical protein
MATAKPKAAEMILRIETSRLLSLARALWQARPTLALQQPVRRLNIPAQE